jgi:asparagine synthetase B (glutamine-hydrolysing)
MQIAPELKFTNGIEKFVLRKIAEKYLSTFAWRKKRASQYGSKVAKLLEKLAKKKGFKRKSEFVIAVARKMGVE